jgi:hypothetical protein
VARATVVDDAGRTVPPTTITLPMEVPVELYCLDCADDREFVQPPCADGHTADGGECPEWACADCGAAFVLGGAPTMIEMPRVRLAA